MVSGLRISPNDQLWIFSGLARESRIENVHDLLVHNFFLLFAGVRPPTALKTHIANTAP